MTVAHFASDAERQAFYETLEQLLRAQAARGESPNAHRDPDARRLLVQHGLAAPRPTLFVPLRYQRRG